MTLYDIHTHHHPEELGTAIVQITPMDFSPRPGHFYSVGLHPWEITDDWRVQMAKLFVMAQHPQVLMIGEAGMDKKHGDAPLELQMEVFHEHIRLSELVRKPLIIHCVKAIDELIGMRKSSHAIQSWILHGYRGGTEQWRQLFRAGIRVSIGEHYNEKLVQEIPADMLLLESDECYDIDSIYESVSATTNVDKHGLQHLVGCNICNLIDCASF